MPTPYQRVAKVMRVFPERGAQLLVGVALIGVAHGQELEFYSGSDSGSGLGPNSMGAAAAFEAAALGLGFEPFHLLDFESVDRGKFLELSPEQTGMRGLSILPAGESNGEDTSISRNDLVLEGFNTTPSGANFLKIEESQPGTGVEPAVGVSFSFDEPVTAFGAYVTGVDADVEGFVTVVFDDGQQQTVFLNGLVGGGSIFWGFVDPGMSGITSVTFLGSPEEGENTDAFGIDDVRWTTAPRPSVQWPGITAVRVEGNEVTAAFPVVGDLTYMLEISLDLESWIPQPGATFSVSGEEGSLTTGTNGLRSLFVRVKATTP